MKETKRLTTAIREHLPTGIKEKLRLEIEKIQQAIENRATEYGMAGD